MFYITHSSNLNHLGLDFIEEIDFFKAPLKSIFNTFQINCAELLKKHFMNTIKDKYNNVFKKVLMLY